MWRNHHVLIISDKKKNCTNSIKVDLTLFIKVTNVYTFRLAIPLPKIYSIAILEHAEYVQGYLLHHCSVIHTRLGEAETQEENSYNPVVKFPEGCLSEVIRNI